MMFFVKNISSQEYQDLGIALWEPWENTTHKGTWEVEETESFYVLDGEVHITVDEVTHIVTKNMLVFLPKGLVCVWYIPNYLKKVYKLGAAN
ncbi:cupin domain-containing protein [Brevibacillus sp. SYSU BS000544]|uniref:cupin domain-containing protein n=1 Tax=Brevibacillus sp. SYSU BS000544 TaxID=3416443 RepID=UPI003CE59D5B